MPRPKQHSPPQIMILELFAIWIAQPVQNKNAKASYKNTK
jgi:hypothetical protein